MASPAGKIKQTDKWCPMARLSITDEMGDHHAANRFYATETFGNSHAARCNCIAEYCAAFNAEKGRCGLIG